MGGEPGEASGDLDGYWRLRRAGEIIEKALLGELPEDVCDDEGGSIENIGQDEDWSEDRAERFVGEEALSGGLSRTSRDFL